MNHLKKPSRREFLANMSYSLGLIGAGHLFNQKIFAQSTSPITKVIHIFVPHGILNTGDLVKGNWFIGDNTPLNVLSSYSGDIRFIRRVNQGYAKRVRNSSHSILQSSFLTGCSVRVLHGQQADLGDNTGDSEGRSVDRVAGEFLKNKNQSKITSLNMSISDQVLDKNSNGTNFMFKTISWDGPRTVVPAKIRLSEVYEELKKHHDSINSCRTQPAPKDNTALRNQINAIDKEIAKFGLVNDNLKNYYSENLMPKVEMEKLEKQINDNIADKNRQKKTLTDLLNGEESQVIEPVNCLELANPGNRFDGIPSIMSYDYRADRTNNTNGYTDKAKAQVKLMVNALASNYTSSVAYSLGGRIHGQIHAIAHNNSTEIGKLRAAIGNNGNVGETKSKLFTSYLRIIFDIIRDLILELKAAGIYNQTLVLVGAEFGNQKNDTHHGNNVPWLAINSGKSGEYDNGNIHVGDIHTSTLNRIGMVNATSFGSSDSDLNRAGRFDPNIF